MSVSQIVSAWSCSGIRKHDRVPATPRPGISDQTTTGTLEHMPKAILATQRSTSTLGDMEPREFEIIFAAAKPLNDPSDERIDRAMDAIPGTVVVASYGDLTLVTSIVAASSAIEAGLAAARALEKVGIHVARTYPDLVSRQDIADRTGTTRQAVGHWVRGDRHDGNFPNPISLVSGGAWLWHDVIGWLRENKLEVETTEYPTQDDHNRLDVMLTDGTISSTVSVLAHTGEVHFASVQSWARRFASLDSYQAEFSLAS